MQDRLSLCNLHCVWCDTPFTWLWEGTGNPHSKLAHEKKRYDPRKEIKKYTTVELFEKVKDLSKNGKITNLVLTENKKVIIADSSGAGIAGGTSRVLKGAGFTDLIRDGVEVHALESKTPKLVSLPNAKKLHKASFGADVIDASCIINLPKLKLSLTFSSIFAPPRLLNS